MREILFRGKRIDNEEWIYGYLFLAIGDAYILGGTADGIPDMTEVNPDTVGEYIGIRDKDGKWIFEHDIVMHPSYWNRDKNAFCRVEFVEDGTAMFVMYGDGLCSDFDDFRWYELEVVGNIFDNPELLEVSTE